MPFEVSAYVSSPFPFPGAMPIPSSNAHPLNVFFFILPPVRSLASCATMASQQQLSLSLSIAPIHTPFSFLFHQRPGAAENNVFECSNGYLYIFAPSFDEIHAAMEGRAQQLWSWWKLIEDGWKEGEVKVEVEVGLWGCSKVSTGRGRRLEWRDGEESARRVRTLAVCCCTLPARCFKDDQWRGCSVIQAD